MRSQDHGTAERGTIQHATRCVVEEVRDIQWRRAEAKQRCEYELSKKLLEKNFHDL